MTLDWVLQKVMGFFHHVGLSCEGFEEEIMALFTAIEASRYQKELTITYKKSWHLILNQSIEVKES